MGTLTATQIPSTNPSLYRGMASGRNYDMWDVYISDSVQRCPLDRPEDDPAQLHLLTLYYGLTAVSIPDGGDDSYISVIVTNVNTSMQVGIILDRPWTTPVLLDVNSNIISTHIGLVDCHWKFQSTYKCNGWWNDPASELPAMPSTMVWEHRVDIAEWHGAYLVRRETLGTWQETVNIRSSDHQSRSLIIPAGIEQFTVQRADAAERVNVVRADAAERVNVVRADAAERVNVTDMAVGLVFSERANNRYGFKYAVLYRFPSLLDSGEAVDLTWPVEDITIPGNGQMTFTSRTLDLGSQRTVRIHLQDCVTAALRPENQTVEVSLWISDNGAQWAPADWDTRITTRYVRYTATVTAPTTTGRALLDYVEVKATMETGPQPPDIRIYGSDDKRKQFPAHLVSSVQWELIEHGYFGTATIGLTDEFDAGLSTATGGDRLEIWLDGALRYRGYIATPEQLLDIPETKSLSCYGLAERLNSILVDKRYCWPGGVDISQAVAAVVADYISPRISGLQLDIHDTGFIIENLELQGNARDALVSLMDLAARRSVWGFDVDDDGNNRIFLRPKSTDSLYTVEIGGNVARQSYVPDYSKIVNRVKLVGGEAKYPNLIANPSFEQPKQSSASDGNLIGNGGFELNTWLTDWEWGNGASRKSDYSRTGSYNAEIDNLHGLEYIRQNDRFITGGRSYEFEMWYRSPAAAKFHVEIQPNNGGALIRSPKSGSFICQAIGAGGHYQPYRFSFVAPAGSTSCSVKICGDGTAEEMSDFRVDDIALWEIDGIRQEGWQSLADVGITEPKLVDWAYDDDSYHGAYCVRLQLPEMQEGEHVWLLQSLEAAIGIQPTRHYHLSARVKNIGVETIAVDPVMWVTKTNGTSRWVTETFLEPHFIDPGDWVTVRFMDDEGWTSASDDSSVRCGLRFWMASDVLVDAMMFCEFDEDELNPPFIDGKNYQFTLSTDDSFVQADSQLPAAVKSSIANYGIRDGSESVPGVATLEVAQNWARGYFGLHAQPVISHKLDVVSMQAMAGSPAYDELREIKPDGNVAMLGTSFDPAFPVRVSYTLDQDGLVRMSVELNEEEPTFEGILQRILKQARDAAQGQVTSGMSGVAIPGGSGGGGGGGTQVWSQTDHDAENHTGLLGDLKHNVRQISTDTTLTAQDAGIIVVPSGLTGPITLTLPPIAGITGLPFIIRNEDTTQRVLLQPSGGTLIEGAGNRVLDPKQALSICPDGTQWISYSEYAYLQEHAHDGTPGSGGALLGYVSQQEGTGDVNIYGALAVAGSTELTAGLSIYGAPIALNDTARVAREVILGATDAVLKAAPNAPTLAVRPVGASGTAAACCLQFDKDTQQDCYFIFHVPEDADLTDPARLHLMWAPGATWTIGNYQWKAEYLLRGPAEALNDGTPTTLTATATPTNANNLIETAFIGNITLEAGKLLIVHLYRNVAYDTGDSTGDVFALELKYTSDKLGS